MNILIHDNFDSFTQILADYFRRNKVSVSLVHNQEQFPELCSFDAVVFSPGPDRPETAGNLMNAIQEVAKAKIPALGVCLGHQAMGLFLGGQVVHAQEPMHGRISELIHHHDPIFEDIPEKFQAMRYHSLLLKTETEYFRTIAETHQHEIMALKATSLPWYGVQFHPESIQTFEGEKIIQNWIGLCAKK
jgi:anthranilate synthase component 2